MQEHFHHLKLQVPDKGNDIFAVLSTSLFDLARCHILAMGFLEKPSTIWANVLICVKGGYSAHWSDT